MSWLALPHIGFVLAAYGFALIVILIMIAAILRDHHALRRALAAYEARGVNAPEAEAP
jgi:heme exporter protein CcmD